MPPSPFATPTVNTRRVVELTALLNRLQLAFNSNPFNSQALVSAWSEMEIATKPSGQHLAPGEHALWTHIHRNTIVSHLMGQIRQTVALASSHYDQRASIALAAAKGVSCARNCIQFSIAASSAVPKTAPNNAWHSEIHNTMCDVRREFFSITNLWWTSYHSLAPLWLARGTFGLHCDAWCQVLSNLAALFDRMRQEDLEQAQIQ